MLNFFFLLIVYIFYCKIPTALNMPTGFSELSAGTTNARHAWRWNAPWMSLYRLKSTLKTLGLLLIS